MVPKPHNPQDFGRAKKEFSAIITRIWDDEFGESDAQKLEELLNDYPEFRLEYLEAKLTREQLSDLWSLMPQGSYEKSHSDDTTIEGELSVSLKSKSDLVVSKGLFPQGHSPRLWLGAALALAAGLMLAAMIGGAWWNLNISEPPQASEALAGDSRTKKNADSEKQVVAHVVDTKQVVAHIVDAVSNDLLDLFPMDASRAVVVGTSIELDSGVTELRFDCGANVVVAGPAHLAIKGPKRVELLVGKLTVQMDKGVDGFEVVTPDGKITDLGTAFGVNVATGQDSSVTVFEGEVELQPADKKKEIEPERLFAGQTAQFRHSQQMKRVDSEIGIAGLRSLSLDSPDSVLPAFKDAYVRGRDSRKRYETQNYGKTSDLLVKYESAAPQSNRRIWIGFDLRSLNREDLIGARFNLTVLPNHLAEEFSRTENDNYQETDTNWLFEVSGLWDEFYQDWDENKITWMSAPGNDPSAYSGRLSGARAPALLGSFTVQGNGQEGDQVVVSGPRLLEFLMADDDGLVTLIVTRRTPCILDTGEDIVVHGFASREHSTLQPPSLELWMSQSRSDLQDRN